MHGTGCRNIGARPGGVYAWCGIMAPALEAFCLMPLAVMPVVLRQKEESPEGNFSINQQGQLYVSTTSE